MAWFYEIRNSENAVLKRENGFASRDSAATAAREDARRMKHSRQISAMGIGNIMVGRIWRKPRDISRLLPPAQTHSQARGESVTGSMACDRCRSDGRSCDSCTGSRPAEHAQLRDP
jgi:hypothetical protein